jgi:hypothetical protein
MPAIYAGDSMKPYREWLPANGFEANASLGGSFYSDRIEDYYQTPWDLGYGRHVKFDHDFIGRAALEAKADQPHRRKLWLRWNNEDVLRVFASQLIDEFEHVGHAGAAGGGHSNADANTFAAGGQLRCHMFGGAFSERDCHGDTCCTVCVTREPDYRAVTVPWPGCVSASHRQRQPLSRLQPEQNNGFSRVADPVLQRFRCCGFWQRHPAYGP